MKFIINYFHNGITPCSHLPEGQLERIIIPKFICISALMASICIRKSC